MSASILLLVSTFSFNAPATLAQPQDGVEFKQKGTIGLPSGGGEETKQCNDDDIDVDAECGLVVGVDLWAECNPLSVQAACFAELGLDCGLQAFLDCEVELIAECQAALEAEGAVFCDGEFKGDKGCWDEIDQDHEGDDEGGCVDGEGDGVDVDLDLDLCLDLDLDLHLDCEVEANAECYAACDPIAVEAWCYAELGEDCSPHEFAQCQAEVLAQCWADCDAGGALFCDGGVYVGADICLGIDIGLHL